MQRPIKWAWVVFRVSRPEATWSQWGAGHYEKGCLLCFGGEDNTNCSSSWLFHLKLWLADLFVWCVHEYILPHFHTISCFLKYRDPQKCESSTLERYGHFRWGSKAGLLLRILWCSQSGNHSQNNLVKFGYILDMKVEKKQNPSVFLATYSNLSLKAGGLKKNFFKIWAKLGSFFLWKILHIGWNIFCRSKFCKNSPMKETLVQGPGSNEIEQSYWMRAINWTHGL